jgi:hypothetical protein
MLETPSLPDWRNISIEALINVEIVSGWKVRPRGGPSFFVRAPVDCEMTIQLGEYKFVITAFGFGGTIVEATWVASLAPFTKPSSGWQRGCACHG